MIETIKKEQFDFLSFTVALIILIGLIATWHLDVRDYVIEKPTVNDQLELWTVDSTWNGGWR